MDKLTSMQVFVKTIELGSFAATAERMNISPQMVAKHINYLEYHLGTTLIHRTTRKHMPTEIGDYYYQNCKKLLLDLDDIESFSKNLYQEPRGNLKISAPNTFGISKVTPFVSKFLKKYPEISIELFFSDDYVSAFDDNFDILIRIGENSDPNLVKNELAPYELMLCASLEYLEKNGIPKTIFDLRQHNCLICTNNSASKKYKWLFKKENKVTSVNVTGNLICTHFDGMVDAALEGLGIILGPTYVLKKYIHNKQLHQILQEYQMQKPMSILYPSNRKPTQKILTFVKEFTKEFS